MSPDRVTGSAVTPGCSRLCSAAGGIIQNGTPTLSHTWRLLLYFCIKLSISHLPDIESTLTGQ